MGRRAGGPGVRRRRDPRRRRDGLSARRLQARICNIVHDDFLGRHLGSGDVQEQRYARSAAVPRGDFFGWTEIYATFAGRLDADPVFAQWFQRLGRDADALADPSPGQLDRLIGVQHALLDVIEFLDPVACGSRGPTSPA